ncbi:hypothetical protein [Bradyrhizobium sp. Ec3.3]|uniref:hypothetical protein n=1 Tax=Bradyrhizobium sp. Ec3.3 TaxID=189753 RepID=UPI0012ECB809|nr:hypothetical protein [Bradyrhizobium sp. Ec3.3]
MSQHSDGFKCRPRHRGLVELPDGLVHGRANGVEFCRPPTARDQRKLAPPRETTIIVPKPLRRRRHVDLG